MNQAQAIKQVKGPCIILAGAGTGKTYTIIEKLKYIIENKAYNPEKIVCLTFSNEAANSLRNRVLKIIRDDKEPIIKTFHSFCSDLLKKHGEKIGIKEDFKILLPEDAKIILHKNFKLAPFYCHTYISTIGTAKDLGISLEELEEYLSKAPENKENMQEVLEELQFKVKTLYLKKADSHEKRELADKMEKLQKTLNLKKFMQSWKAYEKIKALKNLQDYSDLNKKAITLLERNPEISQDYDYVIVDEFQDTNKLQLDFLKLLAAKKDITIVGDLNQSIYRFRGAYKENLNLFKQHFCTTKENIYTLDKSFRSPNTILKTAHALIQNNYKNKEECFFVKNVHERQGEKVRIFELKNAKEEVRKIIEIIRSEISNGVPEQEICVLFRTHQQSQLLKKSLEAENIKYTAVASRTLLKTNEIKLALDYLKILNFIRNPENRESQEHPWWRLIHSSGFEERDCIALGKFIRKNSKELTQKILNSELPELSGQGKIKLGLLSRKIKGLIPETSKSLPDLVLKVYETFLNHDEPNKESLLCMQRFHEIVQEYTELNPSELDAFLYHIQIMENLGIEIEAPALNDSGVRIMTQHATKGLEYKTVIIANLAQKKFPIERIGQNNIIPSELSPELKESLKSVSDAEKDYLIREHERQNQLLEERRLCYVAFTRAKERLYLTYAAEYAGKKFLPSQFLNEISYKKNQDIEFTQDLQELYNDPQLEVKPAQTKIHELKSRFSPSSLLLFDECQKKYEYKYIYNMPEPRPVSWEAMQLGSFVHHVIETGIKNLYKSEKDFLDLTKTIHASEEWNFINLEEALPLIKIFLERNKNKYDSRSLTEINLYTKISGFSFQGFADRIDFTPQGVEIIDYKTGNTPVPPKNRNWQLGLYALAAQEKYGKVYKLTLDMLKKDKPIEFVLDKEGNAIEAGGRMSFNLHEIKEELISTAKKILECYKSGFKPCAIEKNCGFCNEYVWNL